MEIDRIDGRSSSQLRRLACTRNVLNRAHGSSSWIQGETKVLAAVYGPKAGTKKNENPEKASIEVIWKPKLDKLVVNDDGALLPCAINAACAALVDAGIPLKHLAVTICCCVADTGHVLLDPTKQEEEKMKAFVYLVFPNKAMSVLPEEQLCINGERLEHGIITSVTHGIMSVEDYLYCVERGRAAAGKLSDFLRKSLQPQQPKESTAAA